MTMLLALLLCADVQVTLKKGVTLHREEIFLKDVLTQESYHQLESRGLTNRRIAKGPGFNRTKPVHRSLVGSLVKKALPGITLEFQGPASTVVRRAGGRFSPADVESAVRDYVQARAAEMVDAEVEIMEMRVPKVLKVPPGPVDYRVRTRANKPLVGRQSFYVDMLVGGHNFRTLVVSCQLAQKAVVAIASSDFTRGELLSEENVLWEYRHIDRISAPLLTPDDMDELRAKTMVRAGTVLTRRHVETVPLVERNDVVHVTAHRGPLTISMQAKAMDAGGRGEEIRLKNTDSNQILRGTVTAPGQVTIIL